MAHVIPAQVLCDTPICQDTTEKLKGSERFHNNTGGPSKPFIGALLDPDIIMSSKMNPCWSLNP